MGQNLERLQAVAAVPRLKACNRREGRKAEGPSHPSVELGTGKHCADGAEMYIETCTSACFVGKSQVETGFAAGLDWDGAKRASACFSQVAFLVSPGPFFLKKGSGSSLS